MESDLVTAERPRNDLLASICETWRNQIKRAERVRDEKFLKTAMRCWAFLGKNYKELYIDRHEQEDGFPHPKPFYQARLNKAREYVATYTPFLLPKVIDREVTPDIPPLPEELTPPTQDELGQPLPPDPGTIFRMQQKVAAWLMKWWLNYTPKEYNLRRELRTGIQEALVKGRGVVYHQMHGNIPASFFLSVNRLVIDPDCEQFRDGAWIAIEQRKHIWKFAEEFGIPVRELRTAAKSHYQKALEDGKTKDADHEDNGDVITYYEVYSRIGVGQRFGNAAGAAKEQAGLLESLPTDCYLVIVPGLGYPANMPPELMSAGHTEEVTASLAWPLRFHDDPVDPWPVSCLDFIPNVDDPYATSPMEAGLPLLNFLDNAYSYSMSRIRTTCRDIHIVEKSLTESLKNALASGLDQEVIDVDDVAEVTKKIHTIQFPGLERDFFEIIAIIERAFERIMALTPLLQGMQDSQMRSATEAQVLEARSMSRPEDFTDCVEEWLSQIARKEAIAARLYCGPEIVGPVFGETEDRWEDPTSFTSLWNQLLNTTDPVEASSEFYYTVANGLGTRKNRAQKQAAVQSLTQILFQPLLNVAMQGLTGPVNELIKMIGDSLEVDTSKMLLPMPPPPQSPDAAPTEQPQGPQ